MENLDIDVLSFAQVRSYMKDLGLNHVVFQFGADTIEWNYIREGNRLKLRSKVIKSGEEPRYANYWIN